MGETDHHRNLMIELLPILERRYAHEPLIYVSGNLLIYYIEGNRHKHVSPDVFVVRGVPKAIRPNYLVWAEGKGPDLVIELTSKSTRREDLETKYELYRSVLGVEEYFLFDPHEEYLTPQLQGHRRVGDQFVPITPVAGRLPSEVLGLHLEAQGKSLWLWDTARNERLLPEPTARDLAERQREAAQQERDIEREQRETAQREREAAHREREAERARRQDAEAQLETERAARAALEAQLAKLRKRLGE